MPNHDTQFWSALDSLIQESEIVIDRPRGSAHPQYPHFIYPVDYGFANFAHYTPALPEGTGVPVKLGTADTVEAVLAEPGPILVKKGGHITARTDILPEVEAPVEPGTHLGELRVEHDGEVLKVIPLIAGCAVEKLTWQDLFARLLGKIAMGA